MTFLQNKKGVCAVKLQNKNNPVLLKVKKFFVCFALDMSNINRVMNLFGEWNLFFKCSKSPSDR